MKAFQARYKILFSLCIFGLLIAIFLTDYWLPQVLKLYRLYWLFAIVALIILCSPLGNKRLADHNHSLPRKKFSRWIVQILILEMSLLAIFFGICILIGQPGLWPQTLAEFSLKQGLFPWTAIAILACTFGTIAYHYHRDAYFSHLLTPWLPIRPKRTLEIITNTLTRTATLFAFSGTLALYTLLIVQQLLPQELQSLKGVKVTSMIFYSLLLLLTNNSFIKRKIHLFTVYIRCPMYLRIFGLLVILIILVTLLCLFLGDIPENPRPSPRFIHLLLQHGWILNWNLFAFFWWLAWAPVFGIFIAKLSRGYSWRTIILGSASFPLLLSLLIHYWHFQIEKIPMGLGLMIAIIGFLVFFTIISSDDSFDSVMQTFLPKDDCVKYRATDRFLSQSFQFAAVMICFYLAANFVLLGVLFFAFMLLLSILLLLLPFSALFMKKRV